MLLGLLPYIALILLFYALPFQNKDYRERFLYALVIWGVYIFCATELLNFFHAITFSAILCSWLIFIAVCSISLFYNKKTIPNIPKFHKDITSALILLIIILCIIPLITGLIYPPNTYDSMTYHLPRIEHWIQNQSLAMYPTNIERQNASSPFAEMILLHLRILAGNDILYNSLQWLSYASCILLASFIAKLLGAQIKGQIFSSLFCTSISMAILQASSTQNDLVVSLWLVSALSLLLLWYKNNTLFSALMFGCSIGLACITKGTAFAYGLPMVVFFGCYSLFHAKERFFYACFAGFCALLILTPFSIRNYLYVQDIFGGSTMKITALQTHSPNYILANLFCMIFVNFDCGDSFLYAKITDLAVWVFSLLHIDTSLLFPYFGSFLQRSKFIVQEGNVLNYFHFILILLSLCFIKKYTRIQRYYVFLILSMFIVFSISINWQLWVSRLLLSFFILYSPILGIGAEKVKKAFSYVLIVLLVANTFYINIKNKSRPLSVNAVKHVIEKREQNYFLGNQLFYESYKAAIDDLLQYHTIGLIIGTDSYEYPLWALLYNHGWKGKIIHIVNPSDINNCDVVVMLNVKERFGIENQGEINKVYLHEVTH